MLLLPIKDYSFLIDSTTLTAYENAVILILVNIAFYIMVYVFSYFIIKALSIFKRF